jgi:hypothetical protein
MDTTGGPGSPSSDSLRVGEALPAAVRRRRTKVDLLEDPLPEHVQYQDSGCVVSASCLCCPLPACRYVVRGGLAALLRAPRDQELLELHRRGAGIDRLCRQFHLSRRSVFRILATGRRQAGNTSG